jgi:dihydrofolate synthase/folylpolyglutamate synthase
MVTWLYGLQHFGIKLGLDNIRGLLRVLGQPQAGYPSMLVAGTNGKGSVATMVASILAASGVRCGLFTSPHLVRPNERIRLDGRDIGTAELDGQLRDLRDTIAAALEDGTLEIHPSFFEVITTAALREFAKEKMQAAVLEVGLGGRLDATNVLDAEVSVVVSIGLDHTKTLGPTLELIAGEKAGIVKPGKPVISGVVQQRALDVLRRVCRERGARLVDGRAAVRLVAENARGFTLESAAARYPDVVLSLPGRHQIENARIAVAAFEHLARVMDLRPDPDAVRAGLADVRWAGRLQWIDREGRTPLLLDGAHNADGMRTLTTYLETLELPRPVLLFGTTHGKLLLEHLAPHVHRVVLTRPPVTKGTDPSEILGPARRLVERLEVVDDPAAALERARALAGGERYVLVTGSLYLVGEILGLLEDEAVPGPVPL